MQGCDPAGSDVPTFLDDHTLLEPEGNFQQLVKFSHFIMKTQKMEEVIPDHRTNQEQLKAKFQICIVYLIIKWGEKVDVDKTYCYNSPTWRISQKANNSSPNPLRHPPHASLGGENLKSALSNLRLNHCSLGLNQDDSMVIT